jgi:hypothetical protein
MSVAHYPEDCTPPRGRSTARPPRPLIHVVNGELRHNDGPCPFTWNNEIVRIGCTDLTPEAVELIIRKYQAPNEHHTPLL